MSEVLTEIVKADPTFDKDIFLKQCEKDIIPNILEVTFKAFLVPFFYCRSPVFTQIYLIWHWGCLRGIVNLFHSLSCSVSSAISSLSVTASLSLQAMIRGELDVLKDWCYEAVSSTLQFKKNQILDPDKCFFATQGTFCILPGNVSINCSFIYNFSLRLMWEVFLFFKSVLRRTASWLTPSSRPKLWACASSPKSLTLITSMWVRPPSSPLLWNRCSAHFVCFAAGDGEDDGAGPGADHHLSGTGHYGDP